MTTQTNLRLPDSTRRLIRALRPVLGVTSDAAVVALAVERMAAQEAPPRKAGKR